MKLACAYARSSTEDQVGSLPAQWDQLEVFAKHEGYEIVERFNDDGVSGTTLHRPGLNRLLAAAANEAKWEYVLVWDRSRLGRPEDPREAIAMTYQIERYGKKIVALHGSQQSEDPTTNTILEVLEFGQAGKESIRKSHDVLRGQRASAMRGSIPNGQFPYGFDALYTLNGKPVRRVRYFSDRRKEILSPDGTEVFETVSSRERVGKSGSEQLILTPGDPEKVKIVQRVFREYNHGVSPRNIAADLNKQGVPSPRGTTWGRNTIIRMLENPAYKGTLAWNRQTWAKFHTVKGDGQIVRISNPTKRLKRLPQDNWEIFKGRWQGLVSEEEWEKANARLKRPDKPTGLRGKGANSAFLASGLLRCTCGFHYSGSSSPDKRRPEHSDRYYRCNGSQERGRSVCDSKRIRREIVDSYIERRIRERYLEPVENARFLDELGRELDRAFTSLDNTSALKGQQKRLSEVNEQIHRVVDAVASGVLSLDETSQKLSSLRKEKVQLEANMADCKNFMNSVDLSQLRTKILQVCRERIEHESSLWPHATPGQKKLIVRAHVASMMVDYSKSTIRTEFFPMMTHNNVGIGATIS
ncbi:MAG TPA: recombinase family protein [Candidatus Hydrogenedentes bacterium]|nr:recombinase family protein [Candidatus Hydrogenedentota bacterium]